MTTKIKVRVYHDMYGCETGCCGHAVTLIMPNGEERDTGVALEHPYNDKVRQWATEFARHQILSQFPECIDSIDWESIEFDRVLDD